jgi:hypothetical protein
MIIIIIIIIAFLCNNSVGTFSSFSLKVLLLTVQSVRLSFGSLYFYATIESCFIHLQSEPSYPSMLKHIGWSFFKFESFYLEPF